MGSFFKLLRYFETFLHKKFRLLRNTFSTLTYLRFVDEELWQIEHFTGIFGKFPKSAMFFLKIY
jgi:hypothetical protein